MAKNRKRLDELLVARNLVDSRNQAKALIMAGKVRHGTEILDKAGKEYPLDIDLEVEASRKYVSRGAEKLRDSCNHTLGQLRGNVFSIWELQPVDLHDYLLQAGAVEATCVDVGHGQLHYKLRTDPRVINLERINARYLEDGQLPHPDYPIIVMDLSFISLKLILPVAWRFLSPGGILIALIKPQFEAGKAEADRFKGVIRDPEIRTRILNEVLGFAKTDLPDSDLLGWCESPIKGMNGNLEYLAGWTRPVAEQP